jgi:PAS domain S-box-containing protein
MSAAAAILDHVDGFVICLEAKSLRPLFASAATRTLVGEPVDEWRVKPGCWRRLFDAEDWPRIARLCRAVARDGRRRSARHLVRAGAGRPRSFRTSVSRLGEPSGQARLLAHMLDLGGDRARGGGAEDAALREILRQAPVSAFLLDRRGVVRLAEGRGLAKLGVEPAATLGRSMLRGQWPFHWIVENARRALRGDAFSDLQTVAGAEHAHARWLSLKYVPVKGPSGRVRGALGFATDVTECKRIVDLVGTIDGVLWQVQGADRRLSFVGGAATKLFGEDPDAWLGRPDFLERHLVGEERADVMAAIAGVAAEGGERAIAHRIRRRDGRERWCRTTLRGVSGGGVVVGLTLDLTERKTVEKVLLPRDRRWQILAEQAPVIVYTVDRDLCFTSGIGAGMAALGLEATGTLVGMPIEQYFHAAGARPLVEAHRDALQGATVRTRARWRRRTYDLRLEPLRGDDGAIIGVIGVAVDMTRESRREQERERLLEAERVAHAQADEAVHARDQLFGIASHELRTPLSSLLFSIQSARARAESPEMTRKLHLAERQALRLNQMIEQLLDASRLGAGHALELEHSEVELAALAQQVVARFEPELDASKMVVAVVAPDPVVGRWDRTRLDQVITNLLSNAIKYGRGKPVEISVHTVSPALARLSVRDQGVGIPAAEQGLLFRPFRRLPGRRQNVGGFGLGLYIVWEIVRAHGGDIRIESEAEQGARFTVELPIRPDPP